MTESSKAYRLFGNDTKTHNIWAFSDQDAIRSAKKWAGRHGGLAKIEEMTPIDNEEGCWDRSTRREVAFS